MTEFKWTDSFQKQLSKFDKSIKEKIVKKMQKVITQPGMGKPLRNVLKNCFEERIEKYRILYLIDSENTPLFFYIHDKEDDSNSPSVLKALQEAKDKFFGLKFFLNPIKIFYNIDFFRYFKFVQFRAFSNVKQY